MLTIKELKEMRPGIFAQGEGTYPELHKDKIRWVATRGQIHDWALYYHSAQNDWDYVKNHGDKAFTESVIRSLVPCDDEAWGMYRF